MPASKKILNRLGELEALADLIKIQAIGLRKELGGINPSAPRKGFSVASVLEKRMRRIKTN